MRFIYTKGFAVFSFCLVLAAALVFLQLKGLLYPVKNVLLQAPRPLIYVIEHTSEPFKNFFSVLYRLRSISEENNSLKQQNAKLQQELVLLQEKENENQTLKKELGFAQSSTLRLVPCTIISANPFGLNDSIVLNCGSEKGIAEGQAVVSQGFLVGKIISIDRNSSVAMLAISSKFSTDAKISKSGVSAIIRGSFGSGLVLDQLSQNDQVNKGDLVTTAGINEKIPKNILIGEIGEIISKPSDLFKSATIVSPVDFKNVDFVFAIK